MGLRVLERLDERKVPANLFRRGWLEEEGVVGGRAAALGVGERDFGERGGGDCRGGEGRRGVEVLRQGAPEVDDGACRVDGDSSEEGEVLAAVGVGSDVGDGRMREEDEGERRDLSATKGLEADGEGIIQEGGSREGAYFSSSFSFSTSKVSSQPMSIRTLTPPSSSSSDCDATESDRAPWRGQKLNMADEESIWRRRWDTDHRAPLGVEMMYFGFTMQ